ncbi:hypothetical protein AAKU55_005458 [Oxalobacteraceae bacterium GrIS 1.11]
MHQIIKNNIAEAVNATIRKMYPDEYCSLCHVYAIVGSNMASIVLDRVYRPVSGLALIDCGRGNFIKLTDNNAFANPIGGAFHCWIESADEAFPEKEVIDFTFRHNREYATKNKMQWHQPTPPPYLWDKHHILVVDAELDNIPSSFPAGKVWLRETDEGWDWMTNHLAENINAYVTLTAQALNTYRRIHLSGV